MFNEIKTQEAPLHPDLLRTPFNRQPNGTWQLFLIEGKEIEYGHRFDSGIGYRVYIRFRDSYNSNVLPASEAKKLATMMEGKKHYAADSDERTLAKAIRDMAKQVEALNRQWALLGAPDQPLDTIGEAGNV